MLFMGQKPGSMCLEEQVEAVQPRQVGGEAAHQQVGGEAAHQQVGGEAAHQQVGGCPRGSSVGLEPGSMSKAALAQLGQKPQEELDLAEGPAGHLQHEVGRRRHSVVGHRGQTGGTRRRLQHPQVAPLGVGIYSSRREFEHFWRISSVSVQNSYCTLLQRSFVSVHL